MNQKDHAERYEQRRLPKVYSRSCRPGDAKAVTTPSTTGARREGVRLIKLEPLNVVATRVSGKMQKAVLRVLNDRCLSSSMSTNKQPLFPPALRLFA